MCGSIGHNDMNVHETVVKIADDLYVAGFGGSIPAVDQDRHIIWSGFPQTKGDFDISRMRELIQDLPETSSVRELVTFSVAYPIFPLSSFSGSFKYYI